MARMRQVDEKWQQAGTAGKGIKVSPTLTMGMADMDGNGGV